MNVAFIPVRGGSKSIPLKNIKNICGKPLVYWTVKAACECLSIDKVYVATDSDAITNTVNRFKELEGGVFAQKLQVIGRSAESASDTASTELAMLEFAEKYEFDHIALIQATSPLLSAVDLNRGFELYGGVDTDSVLSVVRQKRFCWQEKNGGSAESLNYDIFHRPRRQEYEGYYVENGAFYITSKELLQQSGNRMSGNIKVCEMDEDSFFEIDEPSDWVIIEHLLGRKLKKEQAEKRKLIKMFLTDCDGCLTDGGMYYSENGDELKKFHTQDGMGFQLLREKGIICGIITGESTELVKRRSEKLKLDILRMGVKDKLSTVRELCEQYQISLDEVAYVGDDINDLELLSCVGFSASVPNALKKIKDQVDYVTERAGGDGAVREVIEQLIGNN